MKTVLIVTAWFLSVIGTATAQDLQCGTSEISIFRQNKDSQYIKPQQQIEKGSSISISQNRQNLDINCQFDQSMVYKIPTVVHVMYTNATNNISDAQIISVINGSNSKWRHLSGDGVDMEIQLELAKRDPNGNSTNGITRTDLSFLPKYVSYGVDLYDTLGIYDAIIKDYNRWPRDKYYNIWVVNKVNGPVAYSDGYTDYEYEGTVVTYTSMDDRTIAHETGHYFNLAHPSQGSSTTICAPNNDCSVDGDGVCDTPPIKIGECNAVTCSVGGDPLNSLRNYMGYCSSATRFTQGQKDRVRAALFNEYRISLISSPALIPVTTSLEASVDSVVYVNDLNSPLCGHKLDSVLIRVNNLGTGNVTSVKIGTYVAGVLKNTVTKSVMITSNSSKLVSVPAILFSAAGSYDLSFELLQINSSRIDFDTLNNKICTTVTPIILQVNTTTVVSPPAGGIFTGGKTFTCSGIDTLRVFKNPGYDLIGIYDEGGNFITYDSIWYYPVDVNIFSTNRQFTAELQIQTFRVTTSTNPANAGTVTPGGTYDYGTNIILETHKKPGYIFLYWKKNGVIYSADSSISISVKEVLNFVAVYDIATGIKNNTLNINVSVYPNPTNDAVNISVVSRKKFTGSISVVNILGQNLLQESIVNASAADLRFDVSTFSTGSYFISLRDEEGNQEVYTFIVR